MFSCSACLLRALEPLLIDTLPSQATATPTRLLKARCAARLPNPQARRNAATFQGLRKGHHRAKLLEAYRSGKLTERNSRRVAVATKSEIKNATAREANKNHLDVKDYQDARADPNQRALVEEHLQDPLSLGKAVLDRLAKDDFLTAVALVRASESQGTPGKENFRPGVNNVVSWNHLMDYCMLKHDTKMAQKVYNEMKKRGHKPDSHTYTVMLRGFANAIKREGVVGDAVKVYNSLFAPNSTVKPSIIHTNAVINVCAKAGNMDEIWAIAGRLPESGPGAPDMFTFATILNAITKDAQKRAAQLRAQDTEEGSRTADQAVESAVQDGRKLWGDIVLRWRKADLIVDERLVCAMGRLLLLSPRAEDWHSVFSLVRQAMNVVPPKNQPQQDQIDGSAETAVTNEMTVSVAQNFDPVDPESKARGPKTALYATPGRNTLSMVLEAAILTKEMSAGKEFWDLLTSTEMPWKVSPDVDNIMNYLRLLRISRASNATLELLRLPWPGDVAKLLFTRRVFVLAMSTCVRDKNNPKVFDHANALVDLMQEKAEQDFAFDYERGLSLNEKKVAAENIGQKLTLDPKVLTSYLGLAMATTSGFRGMRSLNEMQKNNEGKLVFGRDPRRNHTMRALRRLSPELLNLKRLITLRSQQDDAEERNPKMTKFIQDNRDRQYGVGDPNRVLESMEDMTELLRTMISAYDRLAAIDERLLELGQEGLDPVYIRDCRLQIQKLSAFHGRMNNPNPENKPPRNRPPVFSTPPPTEDERAKLAVQDEFADEKWYSDREPSDEDDNIDPELTKTPIRSEAEAENRAAYEREQKKLPTLRQQRQMKQAVTKRDAKRMQVRAQFPESMLKPWNKQDRVPETSTTRSTYDEAQALGPHKNGGSHWKGIHGTRPMRTPEGSARSDELSSRSGTTHRHHDHSLDNNFLPSSERRAREMRRHGPSSRDTSPAPFTPSHHAEDNVSSTEHTHHKLSSPYMSRKHTNGNASPPDNPSASVVRKHVSGKGAQMPGQPRKGDPRTRTGVVQFPWGEAFDQAAKDMGHKNSGFIDL